HRSGTSALTGLMKILGFNVGYNLLIGNKFFNKKWPCQKKINSFCISINKFFNNKIKKLIEKEINSKKKSDKIFYSKLSNFVITFSFYLNKYLLNRNKLLKKGHFEPRDIIHINDLILLSIDSWWGDIRPLPEDWEKQKQMKIYKDKIKKIIYLNYGKKGNFCIKEPRISILLPLYLEVFKEMNIEPNLIFIKRNKDEIIKSLMARNDFKEERCTLITEKYLESIEKYIKPYNYVEINYSDLINKPEESILKIKKLNIPMKDYNLVKKDVQKFIDPKLKHH
ncbi:hypothetical protein KY334_03465, partial [Candidatus Woesearchaeota archaeon]|nr:hypothetical protein [Candidatus Woesearchaeota archaeon]